MENAPSPKQIAQAQDLADRGYRRTSNAHGIVSRVDRPDWVDVLATHLRRSPAEFYEPGESLPSGRWCDHYRRCLSKDKLYVEPGIAKLVPSSNFDAAGYVAPFGARPITSPGIRAMLKAMVLQSKLVLHAARGDDLEVFKAQLLALENLAKQSEIKP